MSKTELTKKAKILEVCLVIAILVFLGIAVFFAIQNFNKKTDNSSSKDVIANGIVVNK